jgi:hypothetical protein
MNKPVALSFLALTLMGCAAAAYADDMPAVTPCRPSVSTPAALSAPGWLEVEAGVLCEAARPASRLPPGHPEGFIEAFANVYLGVAAAIRAHEQDVEADPLEADFPGLRDGARGVRFVEAVVASAASSLKWTAPR